MDAIKIINFKKDNPGVEFLRFKTLSSTETRGLANKLVNLFQVREESSFERLESEIRNKSRLISGETANSDCFQIRKILRENQITPAADVYIDWDVFETVDQLKLAELDEMFDYIWYPSADDIVIFDISMEWFVSVTHSGDVLLCKMRVHQESPISARGQQAKS